MRDPKLVAFGQRVRELRKERGFSQEKFAELVGVDRSYMGRIERGEKNITLLNLYKISEALDLKLSDFFRDLE